MVPALPFFYINLYPFHNPLCFFSKIFNDKLTENLYFFNSKGLNSKSSNGKVGFFSSLIEHQSHIFLLPRRGC